MSAKYLFPAILVSLLAGCAAPHANYVAPDWANSASPAGVFMTDGHAYEQRSVKGGDSAH